MFFIWFSVDVSRWEGTTNGFSRTASRTLCGKQFCEDLVHFRFVGETPQSVSRCQFDQEGCEGERFNRTRQPKAEPKVVELKVVPTRNRPVRQSPPEMYAAVHAKILRLQAAISALGDADVVEKENLARALQRAQAQAVVPPVSEQIISTEGFIERERKRQATAEEALIVAVKNRDESLAALAQGEKRLEELQSQEKSPIAGPVVDAETELVRLRAQVAELQGGAEMSITSVIPADAMPRLPVELSVWMADRQTDLQEALSTEDHSQVVKLSLMLTKGAERMVEMSRQDISDDEFRSRGAPGEGWFAPY